MNRLDPRALRAYVLDMIAMVLTRPGTSLERRDVPTPEPGPGQILVRVQACGVCRTDLHILDGELAEPKLPLVLGHQIVGTVERFGASREGGRKGGADGRFQAGDRVGIPWLGWTCGSCRYCRSGRENLCDNARFTGYHLDGGYAQYTVVDERFAYPIPPDYPDAHAAPLLCAGLIGFRSLRMCGDAEKLGLYGFGSAAHILAQVARHQGKEVYAFTRPGDEKGQAFARELEVAWAGGSDELPPGALDAAIIFAPVGSLVPQALKAVRKGGRVVCGGIHMSDIPSFPYSLLWEERSISSVANLTRRDGEEFLGLAGEVLITTEVTTFPLERANEALEALREGRVSGSIVLKVS
jgi:propanol-preferring alcohol dehydrogenase